MVLCSYSIIGWYKTQNEIERIKRVLIKNKNNEITLIMENDILAKQLAHELIENLSCVEKLIKYGLFRGLFKIDSKNILIKDDVLILKAE